MKTDIIVPVFNGLSDSIEMFESLKTHTKDYRLVVVDNASTDGTADYFEKQGVEVLRFEENQGFGAAINLGMEVVDTENVVFLNNDVILTDGWLDRMVFVKNQFPAPVGIVGPVSNFAAGQQVIQWSSGDFTVGNLKRQVETIRKEFKDQLIETSFVSFFCCLVDAGMAKEIGPIEEWFPGGFEDNDYCTRIWEAGWKLLVIRDQFVFHKGSRTLLREFDSARKVYEPRLKYFKKYFDKQGHPKIVAMYRAKNDHELFRKSLEATSLIVDAIMVWDDNSSPSLKAICDEFPKVEKYYESHLPFDEYRDRSMLLSWAKASDYEWALVLDADEVLEESVTYESLHELIRVPDPMTRSLILHEDTFWFDGFFRTDGIWSGQSHDRLFKLNMNQELRKGTSKGFHCSTTPVFPPDSRKMTSIRIKHFGYLDAERRKAKYDFYTREDTEKRPELIGGADYSHLLDDGSVRVCHYLPDNHLSLNMLIRKGEGEEIDAAAVLSELWGTPQEINLLIEEETEETKLLEEIFRANVYIDDQSMTLPEKRNYLVDKSDKRWVLFIDTDEKVEKPTYLRAMMDSDPDAFLFYVKNLQKTGNITISENVRMFRKDAGLRFSGEIHETVEDSIKPETKVVTAPTHLLHYGYLKPDKFLDDKLGDYEEIVLRQLKAKPQDPRPHFSLAMHYFNVDRREEAIAHLKIAVKLNPRFAEALKELAHCYIQDINGLFRQTLPVIPDNHPLKPRLAEMAQALAPFEEKRIIVGKPNAGRTKSS